MQAVPSPRAVLAAPGIVPAGCGGGTSHNDKQQITDLQHRSFKELQQPPFLEHDERPRSRPGFLVMRLAVDAGTACQ